MRSAAAVQRFFRTRRRAMVLGALALLLGVGAAVAVVLAGGGDGRPPSLTGTGALGPVALVPTVDSRSIPASVALRRVASSLRSEVVFSFNDDRVAARVRMRSALVSARIRMPAPSTGRRGRAQPAVPELYVTEKIRGYKNGGAMEPLWEADLLEGAVVELAGKFKSLQRDLGNSSFSLQLASGKVDRDVDGGIGNVLRGQQFGGAHETDAEITKSVERTASRFGLSLDSVTIFHALGAAPAVILTAPNAISRPGPLMTALFGSRPRYEGWYLELRHGRGKPHIYTASFLTGSDRGWPPNTSGR